MDEITQEEVLSTFHDIVKNLPPCTVNFTILPTPEEVGGVSDDPISLKTEVSDEGVSLEFKKSLEKFVESALSYVEARGSVILVALIRLPNVDILYKAPILITNYYGISFFIPENANSNRNDSVVFIDDFTVLKG